MTIPFKLSFIARKDYPSGECIGVFSEDIREILEGEIEPALVISENQDIWVHFHHLQFFRQSLLPCRRY